MVLNLNLMEVNHLKQFYKKMELTEGVTIKRESMDFLVSGDMFFRPDRRETFICVEVSDTSTRYFTLQGLLKTKVCGRIFDPEEISSFIILRGNTLYLSPYFIKSTD